MPKPSKEQRKYYTSHENLPDLLADADFSPTPDWENKIVVLSNGVEYWCNGAIWQPYGTSSSSSVGSLDAASLIAGNPADLDTPLEIASGVQSLRSQINALTTAIGAKMDTSVYDTDSNGKVDAAKQQSLEMLFSTPALQWVANHNLGRVPEVSIIDSTGQVLSADVVHPSLNTTIINFGAPLSGRLVFS